MPTLSPIRIAHSLGREEARRRIASRIDDLPDHIPGGVAEVSHSWPEENRMAVRIQTMGQSVDVRLDIADDNVCVQLTVPLMLSLMAKPIEEMVRARTEKLLIPDGENKGR